MRKFIAIAFIGITCAFFGASNTEAYGGNDKDSIEWEGIDLSTVSYSTQPVYVGPGQFAVYSVNLPTGCLTDYVDIWDSSTTVIPNVTRQKIRLYNDGISFSTATQTNANGQPITSSIKELKYPIKLYRGLAWFTSNSSGTVTSVGYNRKSNR